MAEVLSVVAAEFYDSGSGILVGDLCGHEYGFVNTTVINEQNPEVQSP